MSPAALREFTPLEHVQDAAAHLDFALDDLRSNGAPLDTVAMVEFALGVVSSLAYQIGRTQ